MIAAQPGFDVVELGHDPYRNPIVAWIINVLEDDGDVSSSYTNRVCVDQIFYGMTSQIIIRQPDGSIVFPCSAKFAKGQEAEALAYAVEMDERFRETERTKVAARTAGTTSKVTS